MEVCGNRLPRPASTCKLAGNFTTADFDKMQLTVFWCESYRACCACLLGGCFASHNL